VEWRLQLLAEIRFANADVPAPLPRKIKWQPVYPPPIHPKLDPVAIFPEDSRVINVTLPPFNAKVEGLNDDTSAIQKALDDCPSKNALIYLPNGISLVSNTLRWGKNQRNTVLLGQSREAR